MSVDLNKSKEKILSLYSKKEFDESYTLTVKLLDKNSSDSDLFYFKGLLEIKKENYSQAIVSFNKSIDILRPNIPRNILIQISECHLMLGAYDDAINLYNNIIKELPNDFDCINGLGRSYYYKADHNEAIFYFLKAIKLDKTQNKLLFNLGKSYFHNSDFLNAFEYFVKYLHAIDLTLLKETHVFSLCDYISRSCNHLKRYKELLGILESVSIILPNNTSILYYMGLAYVNLANFEDAERYFSRVYSLNNKLDYNNFNYCSALLMRGESDSAKKIINLAISSNPKYFKYLEFATKIKCLENDIYFKWMKEIFHNTNSKDINKQMSGFGIFSVLDKSGNYKEAFNYLAEANRLKRSSITFSKKKLFIQHSLVKRLDFTSLKNQDNKPNEFPSPIFIIGMPRSGTTLLEQILDSHSRIYGAGELQIIPEIADSSNILDPNKSMVENDAIVDMRLRYFNFISNLDFSSKTHIVDKMPGNYFWLGLILELLPNAKFIHCMRNPMDTCLSIYSKSFVNNLNGCYALDEIGDLYTSYYDLMAFWNKKFSSNKIFNLSYESLVYDNENKVRQVLEFCGVDFEKECLNFYENKRFVKTASSTEVRERIYSKSINRWKNYENQLLPLKKNFLKKNILN